MNGAVRREDMLQEKLDQYLDTLLMQGKKYPAAV